MGSLPPHLPGDIGQIVSSAGRAFTHAENSTRHRHSGNMNSALPWEERSLDNLAGSSQPCFFPM
jgi:hypothetical protein